MLGANDAQGQYRFASKSFARGEPFTCVDCQRPVHSVRRTQYVPFFRHKVATGCGGEGALHKAAIAVLASIGKLRVPRHPQIQPNLDDEVIEFQVELLNRPPEVGQRRRPDIVVSAATGRFAIEVTVSNPLSEERRQWFVEQDLPCIEIQITEIEANSEDMLADFMVGQSHAREWVSATVVSNDESRASTFPDDLPIAAELASRIDHQRTSKLAIAPNPQRNYRKFPPLSKHCDHDQPCSVCVPNGPRSDHAASALGRYREAIRIAVHEGWTTDRDLAIRVAAYDCRVEGIWSDGEDR